MLFRKIFCRVKTRQNKFLNKIMASGILVSLIYKLIMSRSFRLLDESLVLRAATSNELSNSVPLQNMGIRTKTGKNMKYHKHLVVQVKEVETKT